MFSLCITETDHQYSVANTIESNFKWNLEPEKIENLKLNFEKEESAILDALKEHNPKNTEIVRVALKVHLEALRKIYREIIEIAYHSKLQVCGVNFSYRNVLKLSASMILVTSFSTIPCYFMCKERENFNFILLCSLAFGEFLENTINKVNKQLDEHQLFAFNERAQHIIDLTKSFNSLLQRSSTQKSIDRKK